MRGCQGTFYQAVERAVGFRDKPSGGGGGGGRGGPTAAFFFADQG